LEITDVRTGFRGELYIGVEYACRLPTDNRESYPLRVHEVGKQNGGDKKNGEEDGREEQREH